MGRSMDEGFSNQSRYYLVTRHQLFKSDLEDYDKMENQKIGLTRSKFSLHLVNFQRTLRIHNRVYQRFHPSRKKSKSSLFGGSKVTTNHHQLNPIKSNHNFLPEPQNCSTVFQGQLENEETTFKKVGSALTKIIRFNAITEESIGISKEKEKKLKNMSPELLTRTQLYRQLVEKIQQTPLLTTLIPIRM